MPDAPRAEVGHYVAACDDDEARWIADTIAEFHSGPGVADPTGKKQCYGVFAVLCRKRSLFQPVARALEARGIPYELIGGSGFYGRWEIRDVLSYLRVLADPGDNIALARVLQSPSWRLSDRDLFHLSEWAQAQARKSRSPRDSAGRGAPPRRPDMAGASALLSTLAGDAPASQPPPTMGFQTTKKKSPSDSPMPSPTTTRSTASLRRLAPAWLVSTPSCTSWPGPPPTCLWRSWSSG
jgi:hypothetical protein